MNMKLVMGVAAAAGLFYLMQDNTAEKRAYLLQHLSGDQRFIAVIPAMTKDEIGILYDAVANYSTQNKALPVDLLGRVNLILSKYNIQATE